MEGCPICKYEYQALLNIGNTEYFECLNCESVYIPNGINQSGMVGGTAEIDRNKTQNLERIKRFNELVSLTKMLDYGCGNGYLVSDCIANGINCVGYDKFNPLFNTIKSNEFDLVSMIEVIEHTFYPFDEINEIYGLLKVGGVLYIETSFTDIASQESIPIEEFNYVNPSIGHCTIFSFKGLDILMESKGFKLNKRINRNVVTYIKL